MLTDAFNSSSRQVPEDFRITNVTPLFKKVAREELGNYRPDILTSAVGKVFEMVIIVQMGNHLNMFKLIKGSRHGFKKGDHVYEIYQSL